MHRRLGFALGALCVATLPHLLLQQPVECSNCGMDADSLRDLMVGVGLIAGVYFGVAWLEKAPLRSVMTHLGGLALTVTGIFTLLG